MQHSMPELFAKMISRNDWTIPNKDRSRTDLSNNVCSDSIFLLDFINEELDTLNVKELFEYPKEDITYSIISNYYNIDPKMISIGLGSTELLQRICHIFSGSKIKILSPTFEMIKVYGFIYKMEVDEVFYTNFDYVSIDQLIGSELLYISNPNGNNGHTFKQSEVEYLLQNNGFVILDEAYIEYSDQQSLFKLVSLYPNLCILRTFSKSLGCAGIRCGFCYSNKSFIEELQQIRMNYISCGITNYILKNFIDKIDSTVNRMKESKKYLETKYKVLNKNGNFICIKDNIEDFSWCNYKKVEDYYRITLTNKEIFQNNIPKRT